MKLQDFFNMINDSAYNALSQHDIFDLLNQVNPEESEKESLMREFLAFQIVKSNDIKEDIPNGKLKGLSYFTKGENKNEKGEVVPIYFPDVTKLTEDDFKYFEKRFNECNNPFAKKEYGLLVYFGQRTPFSKHNDFKKELALTLKSLSQVYLIKSNERGERNYNFQQFIPNISMAYLIFRQTRLNDEVDNLISDLMGIHQNWDNTRSDTLRCMMDISEIFAQDYAYVKDKIDFDKVVEKNTEAAKELEKTYLQGAEHIADENILIRNKQNKDYKDHLRYKAELLERIADTRDGLAKKHFVEKALRVYISLEDDTKIKELEESYGLSRGDIELQEHYKEFPEEYLKYREEKINKKVSTFDNIGILQDIIDDKWFDTISEVEKNAEIISKTSILSMFAANAILDKYGNTIDIYLSADEIKEMHFWEAFNISYQKAIGELHMYIIEACRTKKMDYESFVRYMETTWYNNIKRYKYGNHDVEVKLIDLLKPGLKKFFVEMGNALEDKDYIVDFVTIIDSLTLKLETILRFYCERIGIATFKTKDKAGHKIMMEKLLDDMLSDLEDKPESPTGFSEEDRRLLKYTLTPKGCNLRNRVAHGLMDIWEYQITDIIIILYLILRLSRL